MKLVCRNCEKQLGEIHPLDNGAVKYVLCRICELEELQKKLTTRKKRKMHRIFTFLNENGFEINVKWLQKNLYGLCDYEHDTITLNLDAWIVRLFVHEVLHAIHPDLYECDIEFLESEMMCSLTIDEIHVLADYLISLRDSK